MNQYNSIFHRIFGLTSVTLHTDANRENSSIKLEMLTHQQFKQVREQLRHIRFVHLEEAEIKDEEQSLSQSENEHITYKIRAKEIVLAALTSNQVILFLALLQTIYFNINQFISINSYIENILRFFQQSWLLMVTGIFFFFLEWLPHMVS